MNREQYALEEMTKNSKIINLIFEKHRKDKGKKK